MKAVCSVWFCVVFFSVIGVSASSPPQSPRGPVSDDLLRLISEYVRSATSRGGSSEGGYGADSNQVPLPILILPIPVKQNSESPCTGPDCNKREQNNFKIVVKNPSLAEEINNGFNNNNFNKAYLENKLNNRYGETEANRNRQQLFNNGPNDQRVNVQYQTNRASNEQIRTRLLNNEFNDQKSNAQYQAKLASGHHLKTQPWNNEFNGQRIIIQNQPNIPFGDHIGNQPLNNQFYNQRSNVEYQTNAEEVHNRNKVHPSSIIVTRERVVHNQNSNKGPAYLPTNNTISNYPKLPNVTSSKQLLEMFHNQYKHLHGQDLPPILIDRSSLDVQAPSSDHLLALFHNQSAYYQHQDLPPAVIDRAALDIEGPVDYDEEFSHRGRVGIGFKVQGPPTPQWDYSMNVKGQLHVPRADYSEPYEMWYDSNTKASRIDFHEGGTRTYRMVLPDGKMQRVAMRVNRLQEINIPECKISAPEAHHHDHMIVPGLPDLRDYQFNGYEEAGDARAERWVRIVQGGPGELGAANGEELKYNHMVLVARNNGKSIPVSYTVKVDSSMLGRECDTYTHKYTEVQEMDHTNTPDLFEFDPQAQCVVMELVEPHNPMHLVHLEPLREFTLPHRDPRYDIEFNDFKSRFSRDYMDNIEEAVRKNLVVQSSRFVHSGNRESATFELEVNFLGDRLDAETHQLLGVDVQQFLRGSGRQAQGPIEDFPHPEPQIKMWMKRLPKRFDWRPRGAVSDVKYQGAGCQSCWAFAVAGAVEGALFVKRKVLVPLSEQCLVDCGVPFGTNGCNPSWPRNAYDHVIARGLPASAEYGPYKEKVDTCKDTTVPPVTHISAYVNVTPHDVPSLQVAIRRHAPSVVIIDAAAKSFIFYKKGVLYDDRCGKTLPRLNHAVLAVGWGYHKKATHFILKNTWSANWGEGGYIRVQGPANTCGVLSQPSYPRLEDNDVDRIPGRSKS